MMWNANWRAATWAALAQQPWDVIVVGGGITGAGIFREAARAGLRTLLLEGHDFAYGTSSRSSKLVHGGLRYLRQFAVRLTRRSVRERQHLLEDGPGMVEPLGFVYPAYRGDRLPPTAIRLGLVLYDLLGYRWGVHERHPIGELAQYASNLAADAVRCFFTFYDAQVDDARLVLRVLREGVAAGGTALNYARVTGLLHNGHGDVVGVTVADVADGPTTGPDDGYPLPLRRVEVGGRVVVNATGAWSDRLRGEVGAAPRLRPLRGSHLLFSAARFPVAQAISFAHPADRRPVFVFPWEGVTLLGTTDLDHDAPLDQEPRISPAEADYLLAAAQAHFPALGLTLAAVQATFAGVRPVIGTGKEDPSKESRDHVIWDEHGLLTVTGGKLTTFRLIALDALRAIGHRLPEDVHVNRRVPALEPAEDLPLIAANLPPGCRRRLLGRYGPQMLLLLEKMPTAEWESIPGTEICWAELRWAARHEAIIHLDDLLLRRVRLGLLLPHGAAGILDRVQAIVQPELGWSDARWQAEADAYLRRWRTSYTITSDE
jgi:glycerol-3-phosphate dehydrogenase